MKTYRIRFLAFKETLNLDISVRSHEMFQDFILGLFSLFGDVDTETQKIRITMEHRNTISLQENVNKFIEDYKKDYPPVNQIPAYFRKLKENEVFLFIPIIDIDAEFNTNIGHHLYAKYHDLDSNIVKKQFKEFFEDFFSYYDVKSYGNIRMLIGEKDKSIRECRFCDTPKGTTFENKAHAISEALGNKKLVLLEECDACNTRFSQSIEPDIITYLEFFRSWFKLNGKGGLKNYEGENFSIDKGVLRAEEINDAPAPSAQLPSEILLKSFNSVSNQNIYRSLCKFFLSVIETKYLVNFVKTVDWINHQFTVDELPKIAQLVSYHDFKEEATIALYLKKDSELNVNLPYAVGEFRYACLIIVFIIPFCNKDQDTFTSEESYKKFWDAFVHFNKVRGWNFMNFSSDVKKQFATRLLIEIKEIK